MRRKREFGVLIALLILGSSCAGTYKTAFFNNQFDRKGVDEITIIYSNFQPTDMNMWGKNKMEDSVLSRLNAELIDTLVFVGEKEGVMVSFLDSTAFKNDSYQELIKSAEELEKKLSAYRKNSDESFDLVSEYDYGKNIDGLSSKLGLFIDIVPETSIGYVHFSPSATVAPTAVSNPITRSFTYLVDFDSNKIVWIRDFRTTDIEYLSIVNIVRALYMSMLYDVQLHPEEIKIKEGEEVTIEFEGGTSEKGLVTRFEGLEISYETEEGIKSTHLSKIRKIYRPKYKGSTMNSFLYSAED